MYCEWCLLSENSNNTANNHKHAHSAAQRLAAYTLETPRANERPYYYTANARAPVEKGVGGEEARPCAEKRVEDVEDNRQSLHRGHILHFVLYCANAVKDNRRSGHSEHPAHNAAYCANYRPCLVAAEKRCHLLLPKEKIECNGHKHGAQAAL